jgi:predicted esterase
MDDTTSTQSKLTDSTTSFGPIHVIEPISRHTHTAILLHGRGSNGEEFAEELDASAPSGQKTLMQKLPGWRWVFPSSRELWSTVFEEEIPAWFEAHSLTDVTARQDLQKEGIGESVRFIDSLLVDELERLKGTAENLVLGGISQGGAIGMWALLCTSRPINRIGAFVGASTWLPFAINIEKLLGQHKDSGQAQNVGLDCSDSDEFVQAMMTALTDSLSQAQGSLPLLSTPVFLGHSVDDAYVDVELGRQARDVLSRIGLNVEWKEYSGAEQEGHWLKVPEEVDDIVEFLERHC